MLRRVRIFLVIVSASSVFAAGQVAFAQGATAPAAATASPPAPTVPRMLVVIDAGTAFGNTEAHLAYQGGLGFNRRARTER